MQKKDLQSDLQSIKVVRYSRVQEEPREPIKRRQDRDELRLNPLDPQGNTWSSMDDFSTLLLRALGSRYIGLGVVRK